MNKTVPYYIYFCFFLFCFYSCSINKYIPEDDRLYTGAQLDIETDSMVTNLNQLKTELAAVLRPEPNSKFLRMRPGIYFFYKNQQEKPGFLNRWFYKKIGEKPVYQSDVKIYEIEDLLRNRLENNGFFYSAIVATFKETKRKASVNYKLKVKEPYVVEGFHLDSLGVPIYSAIKKSIATTPLEKGMRFNLSHLKLERQRIDAELKTKGYYNFNSDFLVFEADTNRYKKKRFDLYLKLKPETPTRATVPYKIKTINVYSNYNLQDSSATKIERYQAKNYIQEEEFFKSSRLDKYITLKEGDFYNSNTSKNTARRLSTIGAYKFVNIQYKEIDSVLTDSLGVLEANIYLSPLTKRAVRTELQAVSKSNNFIGPNLALTYSNRNLFRGGETLNTSINFGYESQFSSGDQAGLSSLEVGLKTELIFPRVIAPFGLGQQFFKYAIPKTKTGLGINLLKRSQLFTLLSGNATYGYTWEANEFITYELNPIAVSYNKLTNVTDEFQTILNDNPFLQRTFDQEFISGLTFSFTYNEMLDTAKESQFYFNTSFDTSGNLISLFDSEKTVGASKEFLGLEYAQYGKASVDFRYHYNFGKNREQTLATRIFGGYGLAYGNSVVVPFVKQYSSGGPYSIRAFRTRSIGPGTYNEAVDGTSTGTYFDQTGNVSIEANLEYRFPIYSFFKGALFVDAGNVWNTKPNPTFSGKDEFTSNFINELGMGTGFGLRIDVQGFVIRFDLAAPFHDPSLPRGERYDFKFDEPLLNFAIGYPF